MTDQEQVIELLKRLEHLEKEVSELEGLPKQVSELAGTVTTLTVMMSGRFDKMEPNIERVTGWKTAVQWSAAVIIPVLIALIGGYFALRAAQPIQAGK